jgi:ATP-dependent Clp protease ATP-binding subunit ClpA
MLTKELEETLGAAVDEAVLRRHEYVTLEHLLFALLNDRVGRDVLVNCGADVEKLSKDLNDYFEDTVEKLPENVQLMPELTSTFQGIIQYAMLQAEGSGQGAVDGGNILAALFQTEQSYAVYLLQQQGVTRLDVLNYIAHGISKIDNNPFSIPFGENEFEDGEFADDVAQQKSSRK